jgi:hypothetical protein
MSIMKKKNWNQRARMMRTLFILSFSHFFIFHTVAQTSTTPYQPGITRDGAIYFLPKTAIRVTVRTVKCTYTPGDFCKYAQRYLRLNGVSTEPFVAYELISVAQTPVGVADSTKAFAVKFDARTVAANVALSDDGTLLAINATPQSSPLSPQHSTLNTQHSTLDPHRFLGEEILAAGSTAKMAELTAQEIYDLRESRSLLIKGQADFMPKDGQQLRIMLSQLNEQDEALTSLFAGVVERDTTEHVFTVVPSHPIRSQVLFRFSTHHGLVEADDLSGAPYSISVQRLSAIPDMDPTLVGKKKKLSDKGIYVNVPSKMRSTLFCGNDVLDTADMPAPQFGHVELLSDQLFNKRYKTRLWLNSVSGAVDRLEAEQPK